MLSWVILVIYLEVQFKKADVKEGMKYMYLKNELLLNVVCICSWCDYNYSIPNTKKNEILNQVLWINSNIRIDNKVVYNKMWEKKGIVYVKDILNHTNGYLSHVEIIQRRSQWALCLRTNFPICQSSIYTPFLPQG